jgi:hypothetical protein
MRNLIPLAAAALVVGAAFATGAAWFALIGLSSSCMSYWLLGIGEKAETAK